jgi:hypothetical protein
MTITAISIQITSDGIVATMLTLMTPITTTLIGMIPVTNMLQP